MQIDWTSIFLEILYVNPKNRTVVIRSTEQLQNDKSVDIIYDVNDKYIDRTCRHTKYVADSCIHPENVVCDSLDKIKKCDLWKLVYGAIESNCKH